MADGPAVYDAIGFSITPLYVLSFGLGGGALSLLQKDRPRWYGTPFAWAAAVAIVLLGCVVMALMLDSGQTIEWFCGSGQRHRPMPSTRSLPLIPLHVYSSVPCPPRPDGIVQIARLPFRLSCKLQGVSIQFNNHRG
jgi:hypothetical protein